MTSWPPRSVSLSASAVSRTQVLASTSLLRVAEEERVVDVDGLLASLDGLPDELDVLLVGVAASSPPQAARVRADAQAAAASRVGRSTRRA